MPSERLAATYHGTWESRAVVIRIQVHIQRSVLVTFADKGEPKETTEQGDDAKAGSTRCRPQKRRHCRIRLGARTTWRGSNGIKAAHHRGQQRDHDDVYSECSV
jgi:hypothetical protein